MLKKTPTLEVVLTFGWELYGACSLWWCILYQVITTPEAEFMNLQFR